MRNPRKTRNAFLAVQMQEGGRCYAYIFPVSSDNNLLDALKILKGVFNVRICTNREEAEMLVGGWNEKYKAENKFLFSE